jgi:tellurite resistance protein TerC
MEIFTTVFMGTPVWMWATFLGIVLALLVLDLGVLHKGSQEIGVAESLKMSAMYISLGLAFSGFVWWQMDGAAAAAYLTAFVVEKTLSMDNVFVIALIFSSFAVPRAYQHRVLFWGILGVILLRGLMIGLGATLVQQYHWVLYIFAAFLVATGVKMLLASEKEHNVQDSLPLRLMRRWFRVSEGIKSDAFFVRQSVAGKMLWHVTPLFLALVMVELADLLFAVDSVPAVFAITTDPFLVYTSNIFAILGLRALYFALAAILHRFAYLKYALSALLIFIGSKIFVADLMGWEKFPAALSLGVTLGLLAAGIVVSLYKTRNDNLAA